MILNYTLYKQVINIHHTNKHNKILCGSSHSTDSTYSNKDNKSKIQPKWNHSSSALYLILDSDKPCIYSFKKVEAEFFFLLMLQFYHKVLKISRESNSWKLTVKNLKEDTISDHLFDAVMLCNGWVTKSSNVIQKIQT